MALAQVGMRGQREKEKRKPRRHYNLYKVAKSQEKREEYVLGGPSTPDLQRSGGGRIGEIRRGGCSFTKQSHWNVMRKLGLSWGGEWRSSERVHN